MKTKKENKKVRTNRKIGKEKERKKEWIIENNQDRYKTIQNNNFK